MRDQATPIAAIAAVAAFKPHLIVLDVMLPDMEGVDVVTRLGAQRAGVPIIEQESSILSFDDLALDEDAREVTRAGQPIELTATDPHGPPLIHTVRGVGYALRQAKG